MFLFIDQNIYTMWAILVDTQFSSRIFIRIFIFRLLDLYSYILFSSPHWKESNSLIKALTYVKYCWFIFLFMQRLMIWRDELSHKHRNSSKHSGTFNSSELFTTEVGRYWNEWNEAAPNGYRIHSIRDVDRVCDTATKMSLKFKNHRLPSQDHVVVHGLELKCTFSFYHFVKTHETLTEVKI